MTSRKITLTYFNNKGRAETARWILKQAGVEFEDQRVTDEEWAALKSSTPTGQIPMLTVDGTHICQSGAIVHYVAQEFGYNGSNNVEAAEVHMVWDCLQDAVNAVVQSVWAESEEDRAKGYKTYTEVALPKFLDFLDRRLEGGNNWLVGSNITAADIAVACFLHDIPVPENIKSLIEARPNIASLVKRVVQQPNIKAWIESRPVTPH